MTENSTRYRCADCGEALGKEDHLPPNCPECGGGIAQKIESGEGE